MKRIVTNTLLVIIFFIMDNTLMPFLAIYGYYPSLLFIFALCYSMLNERWYALGMGIICGFLQDIYFFNGFGVNMLLNMLLCLIAGEIGRSLFKEKMFIPVISIFCLTFIKGLCIYEILHMSGLYSNIYNSVFNAVYSFFIAIIMYRVIYKLYQKQYMIRNWKI